MSNLLKVGIFFLLVVVIVSNTLFVISEVERGVTLRFGEIAEADIKPGLHYKIPLVDDLKRFEARILTVDAQPESFFHCRAEALDCRLLC